MLIKNMFTCLVYILILTICCLELISLSSNSMIGFTLSLLCNKECIKQCNAVLLLCSLSEYDTKFRAGCKKNVLS